MKTANYKSSPNNDLLKVLIGFFLGIGTVLFAAIVAIYILLPTEAQLVLHPVQPQPTITPTPTDTNELLMSGLGTFPSDFSVITDWLNPGFSNINDKNKITVVSVGRMYCSYCLDLYPYLSMMQRRYSDKVNVIGILYEKYPGELDKASVEKHIADNLTGITIGLDTNKAFLPPLGEEFVPVTYVIDKNNTIVYKMLGLGEFDQINEVLKHLLHKENQ